MIEYIFDDFVVVMGMYNEEQVIGFVLVDIDWIIDGCVEVVCVDGLDDWMFEIVWKMGVCVIEQELQGYGVVVEVVVFVFDCLVVVIMDCDDIYLMEYLLKFFDFINDGYDVVFGD